MEGKESYVYAEFGKDEEMDIALLKRLDETGIMWRTGEIPSNDRCPDCSSCREMPGLVLGYHGQSLSCGIKSLSGFADLKLISADEFVEAARKMAQEVK